MAWHSEGLGFESHAFYGTLPSFSVGYVHRRRLVCKDFQDRTKPHTIRIRQVENASLKEVTQFRKVESATTSKTPQQSHQHHKRNGINLIPLIESKSCNGISSRCSNKSSIHFKIFVHKGSTMNLRTRKMLKLRMRMFAMFSRC